ncbi:MAG: hypothetical protein M1297_10470 [Nitrospirae bacterium]|jgi:hypothetical protein|nr:hypothetical protein [Nitrospirota bacterium]
MEDEECQEYDNLLESALNFLDPEDLGRTSFERILEFDFRPLEHLLSRDCSPVSTDLSVNLVRYHRMEKLKQLLLPFSAKDGPLAREIARVSRIAAHPYRKNKPVSDSAGLSSSA